MIVVSFHTCKAHIYTYMYTRVVIFWPYFNIFPRVFNIFTGIEATIFTIFRLRFLGLDGPYWALLGPLLASPASDSTPSTCMKSVSTYGGHIEVIHMQSGRGHQDDGQKFGQILAIVLAIDGHF